MLFWMIVKVAFKSLMANKMRSILAMLGIIIGVAAVIATLAIGGGAQKQIMDRMTAMGTNLLVVRPAQRGTGGRDFRNATESHGRGRQGDPQQDRARAAIAPVVGRNFQIKYRNQNTNTPQVLGTTPTYLPIRDFEIETGRMFQRF